MKTVLTKLRSVRGDEVVVYVKRFLLPRWFPGAAKRHGNLSSSVYRIEEKLNKKCEEIEDLVILLGHAKSHLSNELKATKEYAYNGHGETDWFREDIKYLNAVKGYISKPNQHYKEILSPAFLKKSGVVTSKDSTKKSSHGDIPDNLVGSGDRSIYVLDGVSKSSRDDLTESTGADHSVGFRKPDGKNKSKNTGSSNGKWKNRRSGESQDHYESRMEIGKDDWVEDD